MTRTDVVDPNQAQDLEERRNAADRRHFEPPRFPLRDSNGRLVKIDRRRVPDRRLGGYELEYISHEDVHPELLHPKASDK